MRIGLPLGRALFFVCAFLFSVAGLFPLRIALDWLALDERGLAAREAQGSVWLGALSEAQFGVMPLGDLQASLGTFPLLLGRARVDLRRGDAEPFEGAITVSRHGFGIDDMTGRIDAAAALAPLPITSLDLSEVTARFADGLCVSAEGSFKANVAGDVAGLPLTRGLSGNARCQEGALLLPLVGQTGMEALNLRLFEDGRYEVELALTPTDAAMQARLVSLGFTAGTGGAYALHKRGAF